MATINSGAIKANSEPQVGRSTGVNLDTRRKFDFGDRVADLRPEESPFFVYLSKVAKQPTSDPVFRFLEDRTKIAFTDRSFLLAAEHNVPAAGSSISYSVDTSGGASVDFLIKGMVFAVNYLASSVPKTVLVRVESAVTDNGSTSSFTGKTIASPDGAITAANNLVCQIVGTSFEEGSGSPDVFSHELDHSFGRTQIFKTACEMTNTARTTLYRGIEDEFMRIWNAKLREHKVDIERAMLFGQSASVGGINYSDGIVGHIVANSTAIGDDSAFSYNEGKAYFRSVSEAEMTYDRLLADFEVIYDPARGGSYNKLGLAGFKVTTFFNKLAGFTLGNANIGKVVGTSDTSTNSFNVDLNNIQGNFGHSIMKIDTIYGSLSMVKEPLFRGFSTGYLACIDLDNVAYRPLVGNGMNRDTQIITNVQQADEDLRKDMILTEAGLEVSLPETHFLYNFE